MTRLLMRPGLSMVRNLLSARTFTLLMPAPKKEPTFRLMKLNCASGTATPFTSVLVPAWSRVTVSPLPVLIVRSRPETLVVTVNISRRSRGSKDGRAAARALARPAAAGRDGRGFDHLLKGNIRMATRSFRGGPGAAALVVPTARQHALPG
jgi:hypothetical protein